MIPWLFHFFRASMPGATVFRYVTFRAALAADGWLPQGRKDEIED